MLKIYKASAGSGKTFTLAKEYVKLVLGRKDANGRYHLRKASDYGFGLPKAHGHILAVTFTNKATEEMTARIIKELAVLAHPGLFSDKKSPYLEDFMDDFGASEKEIVEASQRALLDLLFNFNSFNVSTIDSFFQGVLRLFTRELDLPADFELQLDNRLPISVAVGDMLQSINADPDTLPPSTGDPHRDREAADKAAKLRRSLMEWLRRYVMQKVEEGSTFNIFSHSSGLHGSLIDVIRLLLNEQFKTIAPQIEQYLADPSRLEKFDAAVRKSVGDSWKALGIEALEFADSLPDGIVTKNYMSFLYKVAKEDVPFEPKSTETKAAADPLAVLLADAKKKGLADADMLKRISQIARRHAELHTQYQLVKEVTAQLYLLGLFGRSISFIEQYCQDNNLFLLSDTNDFLRQIINEEEAPFIYERFGSNINHYLVDEFQDTSQMQWENMEPLFMESLSHANDNLVIGDEKQCIYRFRNSSPDILGHEVENAVTARYGASEVSVHGNALAENSNYRSAVEIVKFNNSLFHALPIIADLEAGDPKVRAADSYANIVQRIPDAHLDFHGYVKVHFVPDGASEAKADADTAPDAELAPPQATGDEYALDRMVQEIDRQLSAGYEPRDIAVLVNKHAQGRMVVDRLLKAFDSPEWTHGPIDLLSNDALSIGSSSTVKLIVSLLRLLVTPQHVVSTAPETAGQVVVNPAYLRARLLNRFQVHLYDTVKDPQPDGSVVERRVTPTEALAAALADDPQGSSQEDVVRAMVNEILDMDCPNLISITERIIDRFVPAESKVKDMAFITAFQDLVVDYSERFDVSVAGFLDWWSRFGNSTGLASPAGINAITITTIHQSKGLQYSCVHVPFASEKMVKYHSSVLPSYGWYALPASTFPELDPEIVPPYIPHTNSSSLAKIPLFKDAITTFGQTRRIDSLNVAYVAFTRAVNELVVYTKPFPVKQNGDATPEDNLGSMIGRAIGMMTEDYLSADHPGLEGDRKKFVHRLDVGPVQTGSVLEFGVPTRKSAASEKPKRQEPFYASKLQAYNSYDTEVLALSKADIRPTTLSMADPRQRGIFLHSVLQSVRHRNDLPVAFQRMAYRCRLTHKEKVENLNALADALATPEGSRWFCDFAKVANERSLLFPDGAKRPDRVVWLPDGSVEVVDYKFGSAEPEKYRRQVCEYVRLLRATAAVGQATEVRGFLWYPLSAVVERIC